MLLKNFFIFCLTITIIIIYLILRFTRKFLNITLTVENLNSYYYLFFFLLIIHITLVFILLILVYLRKREKKKHANIDIFLGKLQNINILWKTYDILMETLPVNIFNLKFSFAKTFLNWTKNKKLIFIVFPRLIILLIFFFEIYFLHIHYYFYSLLLLLFVLIFKFLIFVLKDLPDRYEKEVKKIIILEPTSEIFEYNINGQQQKLRRAILKLSPNYSDLTLDHVLTNYYYPIIFLSGELNVNFLPLYVKVNTRILFLYYVLHIIGWLYILYFVN